MVNPNISEAGKPFRFTKERNPRNGGRPKKTLLTDAFREWLGQVDERSGLTNAERVAIAVGKKALKGNAEAARMVADRTEGKPRQAVELSGSIPLPSTTSEEIEARLMEILKRAQPVLDEQKIVLVESTIAGDQFERAMLLSMNQIVTPVGPTQVPQAAVVRAGWRHYT
jgi:hypothetical protein